MKTARASRFLAMALALSMVSSVGLTPRRAEAGWGLIFAAVTGPGVGVINVGSLIFFSGSVGGMLTALHLSKKAENGSAAKRVALYLVAGIAAVGALYLLDGESGMGESSANFAPMSETAASKLGLTQSEQGAFNSELPLINAVKEEVLLRTEREFYGVAASSLDAGLVANAVRMHWLDLAPHALSAEAILAVEKIGRGI